MATDALPPSARLTPALQLSLLLVFGVSTSAFVLLIESDGQSLVDLLLMASSLGALVTAGLWLWWLAARRSRGWGWAIGLTLLIPYVNFVVATMFARRYWRDGARAPALLALAGMFGQTLAAVRMIAPQITGPV
ncbi:MAG TPA: hypothetical protein VMR50_11310 [Myxococcota bacterium]|nr:hypothetical protein [Myxococcota bacterium]